MTPHPLPPCLPLALECNYVPQHTNTLVCVTARGPGRDRVQHRSCTLEPLVKKNSSQSETVYLVMMRLVTYLWQLKVNLRMPSQH